MKPARARAARTLAVSIGNTTIFAGLFAGPRLVRSVRLAPEALDRLAAFARPPVAAAVYCSVVPALTPAVLRVIARSTGLDARRLDATSTHGLAIGYRRPAALGADRVAAALGAQAAFPRKNLLVVDCGTATTVTALRRDGTLLGGAILPGLSLWPAMLGTRTAQLPVVAPARPRHALGRSPREAIASGVFFGHLGAIHEVVARVRAEAFGRAPALVVGTGGHAARLADDSVFDVLSSHLVLHGLRVFATGVSSHAS